MTALHLGPVDTSMWERVTDNPAFDAAQKRFRRMGFLTDVTPEKVAADTVAAIEKGRREVRHPKRLMTNMALNSAPRPTDRELARRLHPPEVPRLLNLSGAGGDDQGRATCDRLLGRADLAQSG